MLMRLVGLFCWAFGVWVLLTWTLNAGAAAFGAVVALAVAVALAPLGEVAGPGGCCAPRRLAAASGCWSLPLAGSWWPTCGCRG